MIFIAEIGLNYNGNFDLIYEMIKKAKYSGATICKFQLGWRDGPGEINQLDEKKIKQIIIWCESFKIESMFSIISEKAYSLIKKFNVNKIKIASRSLKYDFNLVKKIVNENKKKIFTCHWACGIKQTYLLKIQTFPIYGVFQNIQHIILT